MINESSTLVAPVKVKLCGRKVSQAVQRQETNPVSYWKDIYFVEYIIAERMAKKRKEWLVRWKGFGHDDDTWEPLEHLSGCEQYIARFEEERDRKQAEDDDARGQKRKSETR